MAIGALYGRALGVIMQAWQKTFPAAWMFQSCKVGEECVSPGLYAIAGAASALAGVTRLTGILFVCFFGTVWLISTIVSLVVIMFELTGALPFVLPIMIAVMLAKQVADGFGRRGIYETWIHLNGYPYLDKVDEYSRDLGVREVMTKIEDLVVIPAAGSTIDSLSIHPLHHTPFVEPRLTVDALLRTQPYKGFPVVTDTRKAILVGYISRSELRFALGTSTCLFR